MSEPEVIVLPDPAGVAGEAAERIAAALVGAVEARGRADWATTGGSTPAAIYRLLAVPPLREHVPWDAVHLWWGDDRFVPPDDPLSNVLVASQTLLGEVAIPADHVHPFPVEPALSAGETPDGCAARYADALRDGGVDVVDGWPAFDLAILGIGPDAHLLSVFPGSPAFDRSEWALGIPAPAHLEPHVPRVTLNPRVLDVARTLLAIVHGAGKAAALGEVFGELRDERRWPAQVARRAGATWIVDEAAAEHLPGWART